MLTRRRRSFRLPLSIILTAFAMLCALSLQKESAASRFAAPAVGESAPLSASSPASPAAVTRYRIDAARSQFTVRAFTGGLLSSLAHDHTIAVRNFSGEARLEDASVQLNVKANSLAVVDKVSDKDKREIEAKMRDEVLEVSKYPEISFRSTRVEAQQTGEGQFKVRIEGELSLHGVRRTQVVFAQVSVRGDTLRARGDFQLRQTDFDIKPPSVGMGTIKVKNALKLSFDIVGNKI